MRRADAQSQLIDLFLLNGNWRSQLAIRKNTDSLFSMASEALRSIRTSLVRWQPLDLNGSAQVLPLGIPALDAALPGGGLALGGVTELQIRGASGIATSFALAA